MRRAPRLLLAVLAGAALAAGCGSDADEQGTEGSPPEVDTQRPEPGGEIGPDEEAQPESGEGDGG